MGDDIFVNRINDVYRLCEKYHSPRFSKFLDEEEISRLKSEGFLGGVLFGGYEGCERKILGAFPDWMEPSFDEFPIKALHIIKRYEKELSHRNYLGTILSLGIERNKIGDILVLDDGAYVFVLDDIADFIKDNIKKISHCGVYIEECNLFDVKIPEKKHELLDVIAAALRVDAVLAGLLHISRNDAKSYLSSGYVKVNHTEIKEADFEVKENDLLSIRGFGRTEIFSVGNKTRSDRVHITIKKYL